jgi:hypothetical protein
MASIVSPTTFKVTIREEQTINGVSSVNKIEYSIPSIKQVDRRLVTCPQTTSIDLFDIDNTSPGSGQFVSSSLKYVRVSNLDDTNPIALTLSGSEGTFTQNITANTSYVFANSSMTASNAEVFDSSNYLFNDGINTVKVYASGSDVDVEYTIVNA